MNKKTIVISLVAVFLVLTTVFSYFVFFKPRNASLETETNLPAVKEEVIISNTGEGEEDSVETEQSTQLYAKDLDTTDVLVDVIYEGVGSQTHYKQAFVYTGDSMATLHKAFEVAIENCAEFQLKLLRHPTTNEVIGIAAVSKELYDTELFTKIEYTHNQYSAVTAYYCTDDVYFYDEGEGKVEYKPVADFKEFEASLTATGYKRQ